MDFELIDEYGLRCLVRVPQAKFSAAPVLLVFLHGYDEGAPSSIIEALTRHGPLRKGNPTNCLERFLIVAPQLPERGDIWSHYAETVEEIARDQRERRDCDPRSAYLTGFSFGANGVFDLILQQHDFWCAGWAVDPTRVPVTDLNPPLWVSLGQASRHQGRDFIQRLGLQEVESAADRIWTDEGADHVGTATRAYRDARIYEWLLSRPRSNDHAAKIRFAPT